MKTPLITAAMIVRDEEVYLPACLESLKGVVDELVVVDTGSIDSTPEIALKHGAKLIRSEWIGDFAHARNRALASATGRWILYIDADERVSAVEQKSLVKQLQDEQLAALTVRFRPASHQTCYREIRIFRNEPDIRFAGTFHETQLPDLWKHMGVTGRRMQHADIAIDHVGYDGPQDHNHSRNLPFLQARLESTPEHLFSWVHLGSTYKGTGNEDKAEQAWNQALELVRSKSVNDSQDCLPFLTMLRFREHKGLDTDDLLDEALLLFPENLGLLWLHGCRLIVRKQFADALQVLKPFAAINAEDYVDPVFAYDKKIFSLWVHDALGLCYFNLSRHEEAVHHFAIAENTEPSRERKAKRLICEGRVAHS